MPVLRTPRYRGLVAGALIALAGVAAWATVQALLGSGTWSSDDGTALVYAPKSGEYAFAAAKPNDARRNQVFSGDAGALAAFETTHPLGAITALPASGDPVRGTFSPVVDWPLVAIHAVLTPDGRVLTYGSTTTGVRTGYFDYDVWDPQLGLGLESHTTLPNTSAVDIFCNTQLLMPNGTVEMWGGDILDPSRNAASLLPNDDSNVFFPADNTLIRTGKMHRPRWYASSTMLPNGEVYLQGGTGGGDYPEVRTGTGEFRLLTGAPTGTIDELYPRNFLAPDGTVFGIMGNRIYRVDASGPGAIMQLRPFNNTDTGSTSTSVMVKPGLVMQVGGGYNELAASPDAHLIDMATTDISAITPPAHRRHWANATALPDGRVFLSGGSTADNDPVNGVAYTSEIYDPATDTWSLGATARQMRLYHSAALLLRDGTVLTMGGGANGPQLNLNAEIYYPPYLFQADGTPAPRPVIASAPMTVDPGRSFRIGTPVPSSIARVTLVKSGSVTHSVDMDQRFLELPFSVGAGELQASLPPNIFDTPPGYYMVFLIDRQGVPSEAAMMRINIQPEPAATLTVATVVVNDNGGKDQPSDFRFSVNGSPGIAFEADGSNQLTVPAGTYDIEGPATPGYAPSLSGCSDIVLAPGGSANCTITHDDTATQPVNLVVNGDFEVNTVPNGSMQHVKSLVGWASNVGVIEIWKGSNGYVAGSGDSHMETDAVDTGPNFVYQDIATQVGATYDLSFLQSPRPNHSPARNAFDVYWNDTRITSIARDGQDLANTTWRRTRLVVTGTGTDRLSFREYDTNKSGAFLDDVRLVARSGGTPPPPPPATLTITKVVINDHGGSKAASDFSFSVNGAAPVAFEGDGSNMLSVPAGTYNVTEPPVPGYAASLSGCSNIVLAAGDSATCTITNDDVLPAAINLVVNGSFEVNSVPDGNNWRVSNLLGWSNTAGSVEVFRSVAGVPSGDGNSHMETDAMQSAPNAVYQDIVTVAGTSYDLSFLQSPRPGYSAARTAFEVFWNDTRIAVIAREGGGLALPSWETTALVVVGTGADRLWFREYDADKSGAFVDDVRLVPR